METAAAHCPFSSGSTDVFICTSPIKKFKYCPYEKVGKEYIPGKGCCVAQGSRPGAPCLFAPASGLRPQALSQALDTGWPDLLQHGLWGGARSSRTSLHEQHPFLGSHTLPVVVGRELRASHMPGKRSDTQPHPQTYTEKSDQEQGVVVNTCIPNTQ